MLEQLWLSWWLSFWWTMVTFVWLVDRSAKRSVNHVPLFFSPSLTTGGACARVGVGAYAASMPH
ncbi:hypothetical protein, partial [Xanthomonas fragariae]|uniref:hypothetical protein n=1 Tax=Xanthomonas fragariae TaxID=48664 RepID=UPI001ADD001F